MVMISPTTDNIDSQPVVGRFAPSPTGRMHAGNIFAFLMGWLYVRMQEGSIVLRIEDLDQSRSRPEFSDALQRDFETLGLTWDKGPFFQHDKTETYREVFHELDSRNLVYPCWCSRADLHAASAPHQGEGYIYSGTCKKRNTQEIEELSRSRKPAYRLRVASRNIAFTDELQGAYSLDLETQWGDFVIRRSDNSYAYQLAVVLDDADQGINVVVRGCDLLQSTPSQIYLQELLGLPLPKYAHIPLLVSPASQRLSKRNKDASLEYLTDIFKTPEGIIGHISYLSGLTDVDEPLTPHEILQECTLEDLRRVLRGSQSIVWS